MQRIMSPTTTTLIDLVRQRAADYPEKVAYHFLSRGAEETLTWKDLEVGAMAVAAELQARGMAGERALISFSLCPNNIIAFLGCLFAGTVAVPSYPLVGGRYTLRINSIIKNVQPAILLAEKELLGSLDHNGMLFPTLDGISRLAVDTISHNVVNNWTMPAVRGDSLAILQYTSGSTTVPRGVMLSHANLLHNLSQIKKFFALSSETRGVSWLPPYHDMGLISGIVAPLYAGFPITFMSPMLFFQRPARWLQTIARTRASCSGAPNFAYDLCVRKVTDEDRATLDLSCWKLAFCGAEPISPRTIENFTETFASCGFRPEAFYPCYGLAEATLLASGGQFATRPVTLTVRKSALEDNRIEVADEDAFDTLTITSCGHLLSDQRTIIVDPATGIECPPDTVGEVWISGPSVAKGYWNRPEETRETFEAYLVETREGPFLRTGDLGFFHERELFITGRLKDLIIVRGRNLYPQDIERTVAWSYPALQQNGCAAFSITDVEGEKLVVIHEVFQRQPHDFNSMIEAIRQAIENEHSVETYAIVFVNNGTIPRTSSGKIQRQACRESFLSSSISPVKEWRQLDTPQTDFGSLALTREKLIALAPDRRQSYLEAFFQAELARAFQVDPSAINPRQSLNYFGLDSLKITEWKIRMETCLGVSLSMANLLRGPSITQLASEVLTQLSDSALKLDIQKTARILQQIEQLSDEDVKTLLHDDNMSLQGSTFR